MDSLGGVPERGDITEGLVESGDIGWLKYGGVGETFATGVEGEEYYSRNIRTGIMRGYFVVWNCLLCNTNILSPKLMVLG